MVAMGVSDKDVRDGFAAHGIEQRRDMRFVERTGIDDGDAVSPDDVRHRALERERPGIVAKDAAHPRRDLVHRVGSEIELLVERDVVAQQVLSPFVPAQAGTQGPHAQCLWLWVPASRGDERRVSDPVHARPAQPSLRPITSSQRTPSGGSSPRYMPPDMAKRIRLDGRPAVPQRSGVGETLSQ